MKNLMIVAALALGSMTAFAQETPTTPTTPTVPTTEEATTTATEMMTEKQDEFAEIDVEELPEAITEALSADHPGATIGKAYVNESAQYKLEIAKEDGTAVEMYADAEGNWIEM